MSTTCLFEQRLQSTENRFGQRVQAGFQPNYFYLGKDGPDMANFASGATTTSMAEASLGCLAYQECSLENSSRWNTEPLGEPAQMGQQSSAQRHVVDTSKTAVA